MIYEISHQSDTSSSCSECKREQFDKIHTQHHGQSDEEEEERDVRMSNKLSEHRFVGSEKLGQISKNKQIMGKMQEEMRELRLRNIQQDRQIKELKYQIELSRISKPHPYPILNEQTFNHLSPRGVKPKPQAGRLFSPDYKSTKTHKQEQPDFLLITKLQKEIKENQLQMLTLKNKLEMYEGNLEWMQKFICSFTKMAEELSINYGGQKIRMKGLTLRKKTKACWKYVKKLISHLLK